MAQFARPDGDISTGSWTTAPLWSKLDETPADDADNIQLNNSAGSNCEVSLTNVTDPVSSVNHTVRIRAKKTGTGTITCTGYLFQGTTQICTFSVTLGTNYGDTAYTLTAGEANSITDYSDLRIRINGVCNASGRYVNVSWAELEVPDYGTQYTQTVSGTLTSGGVKATLISRAITATTTSSGTLNRLISRSLSGAVSSITGALIAARVFFKSLSGSLW